MKIKIYIQDLATEAFYGGPDRWVKIVEEAIVFDSASEAVDLVIQSGLHNVQVVVRFEEPAEPERFPLKTVGEYPKDLKKHF